MPDDTALPALYEGLGLAHTEILIVAAGFFNARIEDDEVMDEFKQALFATQLAQLSKQGVVARVWMGGGFLFLPA